jgi:hypothetical protein
MVGWYTLTSALKVKAALSSRKVTYLQGHSVTMQKVNIDSFTAMKTSHLKEEAVMFSKLRADTSRR